MITRPLDLASKLRPEPRNFDALFLVNGGLLVLFFALFGSKFVLAPSVGVDFRLPVLAGANVDARAPTHTINVTNSGQILTPAGVKTLAELGNWLKMEAANWRANPSKQKGELLLLVLASNGVTWAMEADIANLGRSAGFFVQYGGEDKATATPGKGR